LQDVSFEVNQGETVGIFGQNGAGKSTLLKLLTGVLIPDTGDIKITGRITGLLELGTGFNAEFSGLDNIFLNATYLGLSKDEIKERLESIVEFTELGDFIHEPVKTYSSGMLMRLAFSVAIHADPQCFVVDEALSVGDAYFQQKCMQRIKEFKQTGGSIVLVSHDMGAVKALCDRAMLMDHGRIIDQGDPERVAESYNYLISKMTHKEEAFEAPSIEKSGYGNYKIQISNVSLLNTHGQEAQVLFSGKPAKIRLHLYAREQVPSFNVGILFRDRFGQDIFGTNTYHLEQKLALQAHCQCCLEYSFEKFNLGVGKYSLTVAVHRDDTHVQDCYHWIDRSLSFEVLPGDGFTFVGLIRLEPEVQLVTQ
jgi:lipopolysaccharide transport system ATP-binding protein